MRYPHVRSVYPLKYSARRRWLTRLYQVALGLPLSLGLAALAPAVAAADVATCSVANTELSLLQSSPQEALLRESWQTYRDRFIQGDGRVIDREDNDRSTSEGQAYAMWRAVLINDPDTFQRTYAWAEGNLARRGPSGEPSDTLWSWHWGRSETGAWQTLDPNFATDADIDAATALILAARRWNCPAYLEAARAKLADIWAYSTVELPDGSRQLLPGPAEAFWNQPDTLILNPSYFSPYAYRLFAQVDPQRPWLRLVDSGYAMLQASSAISPAGLPADWIAYDPASGTYRPLPPDSPVKSNYSFDAFRVWWRIALDSAWFAEPRARAYLSTSLDHLEARWRQDRRIPARISLAGEALVDYEATAQYAMLYPALQQVSPLLALQIYRQKLAPAYRNGFWDNDTAYYTQNLAWFALLPKSPPDIVFRTATGSR
ncbi:MAG: glycosyl hydrolase [Cyanobacteria bacterium Co-bin13]|nr:glycosyl hydrolase [Cyanobacteria bacterium Co-bin13]